MKNTLLIVVVALAILVAVVLLANRVAQSNQYNADPEVAVTIFPLYDIVRNVAGDTVDVGLILPPGANPHTYEPTPLDVAAISDTTVVYRIGYGIDDWATRVADAKTDVLTLSADLSLQERDGAVDPHYWLTIANAKHLARVAAQDLSSHFPAYRDVFQANLAAYLTALDAADAKIRAAIDPLRNKRIVTLHDAWYYFAEAYGLSVIGTFEPAAAEEPTPQALAELVENMNEADVHTMFVDADESDAAVATFAEDHDYTLLTVDAEGATYDSYIDLMIGNAYVFAKNQ